MNAKEMIEEYQCPGCVCGSDTSCGKYKESTAFNGVFCESWVPGTIVWPNGAIALGMPKGFNKGHKPYRAPSFNDRGNYPMSFLTSDQTFEFNKFNVAVWCLEMKNALFVRMFSPRINMTVTLVFDGKTQKDVCPEATNIQSILDEMD